MNGKEKYGMVPPASENGSDLTLLVRTARYACEAICKPPALGLESRKVIPGRHAMHHRFYFSA